MSLVINLHDTDDADRHCRLIAECEVIGSGEEVIQARRLHGEAWRWTFEDDACDAMVVKIVRVLECEYRSHPLPWDDRMPLITDHDIEMVVTGETKELLLVRWNDDENWYLMLSTGDHVVDVSIR